MLYNNYNYFISLIFVMTIMLFRVYRVQNAKYWVCPIYCMYLMGGIVLNQETIQICVCVCDMYIWIREKLLCAFDCTIIIIAIFLCTYVFQHKNCQNKLVFNCLLVYCLFTVIAHYVCMFVCLYTFPNCTAL